MISVVEALLGATDRARVLVDPAFAKRATARRNLAAALLRKEAANAEKGTPRRKHKAGHLRGDVVPGLRRARDLKPTIWLRDAARAHVG